MSACARPPEPLPWALPVDLTLQSIRVVEARAHPIYAEWTKAPPITQLIEIDFSSATDFVGYASQEGFPFVRADLFRCTARQEADLVLRPFGGHVYWDIFAVDALLSDAPALAELRGRHEQGPPYFYRSFIEIAATGDRFTTPPRLAYDLLKRPDGLCLQLEFTDLKTTPRYSNIVFVPQDTVTAAFRAGDLEPGTAYHGPKLP
jgi:hypothetical protein